MGAPAREGGAEGCKVGEAGEKADEGCEGEKGEASLRVTVTSATANTIFNPRG